MLAQLDIFGGSTPVRESVKPKAQEATQSAIASYIAPYFDVIPKVSIHPDRISIYKEINWIPYRPTFNKQIIDQEQGDLSDCQEGATFESIVSDSSKHELKLSESFLKSSRTAGGLVSSIARRKIMKALDYLMLMASEKKLETRFRGSDLKFKISFVTLTLPSTQIHDDNVIKNQCLNQFFVEAKKKWNVHNYLWRAEKQKNGNLHFHVITDKFIPWSELRDCWNRITNKLGYVDRYRDEMRAFHAGGFKVRQDLLKKWEYKKQLRAYNFGVKTDWHSPNSTDIHSIRKIHNVRRYVSKYMVKNEGLDKETGEIDETITSQKGRIWGCNRELSNVKGAQLIIDGEISSEINRIVELIKPNSYQGEYFQVFYVSLNELLQAGADTLFNAFPGYLYGHFNFSLQKELIT